MKSSYDLKDLNFLYLVSEKYWTLVEKHPV